MCRLMRCPLTRCQSAAVPEARLQGRGEADGRGIRGREKPTANGKHTSPCRSNGSFFCGGAGWQASRSKAWFKNRGSAPPLLGATRRLTEILCVMRGQRWGRRKRELKNVGNRKNREIQLQNTQWKEMKNKKKKIKLSYQRAWRATGTIKKQIISFNSLCSCSGNNISLH